MFVQWLQSVYTSLVYPILQFSQWPLPVGQSLFIPSRTALSSLRIALVAVMVARTFSFISYVMADPTIVILGNIVAVQILPSTCKRPGKMFVRVFTLL